MSCKIVLVGEQNTGKSSLLYYLINNKFLKDSIPTIGVSYNVKIIKKENQELNLEFWDTAGTETYRSLSKLYYRESDFILLCFDVSNKDTFLCLESWIYNIKENCSNDNVIIYLLGNKSDLEYDIPKERIDKFCEKYKIYYMETSSKNKQINNLLDVIFIDYNKYIKPLKTIKNKKYVDLYQIENKIQDKLSENENNNLKKNNPNYYCWLI